MAKTYRNLDLTEQWIVLRAGDVIRDCEFFDCVVVLGKGTGEVEIVRSEFYHCTFVGRWPPEFLAGDARMACSVIPKSEPEVMTAIFRPWSPKKADVEAKGERRRRFNLFKWRK